MSKLDKAIRQPKQLTLPCVERHEAEVDYQFDRYFRHMEAFNKDADTVFIYDLDYTTFERPKIFTHKPTFSFMKGFKWEYSLAWYIFWDSFIVSLFDKPLPLLTDMQKHIKLGRKVGIFSARSIKWYTPLWVRLKIGKVEFLKFRPKNDNTKDDDLKERYLQECCNEHSFFAYASRIVAWDDRADIIKMYKQNDVEGFLV